MGGSAQSKPDETVSQHLMPLYYTKDPVTAADIELCSGTWLAILNDNVPIFKSMRDQPGFGYDSCRIYFYTRFYDRLMNVRPETKGAFRNGVDSVGTFMTKMLSLSLSQLENPEGFKDAMQGVALRHCQRGIQTYEYFPFGDVLFFTLQATLGSLYTIDVDRAWKHVYSSMLSIIIPVTISFGLQLAAKGETTADIKLKAFLNSSFSSVGESERNTVSKGTGSPGGGVIH